MRLHAEQRDTTIRYRSSPAVDRSCTPRDRASGAARPGPVPTWPPGAADHRGGSAADHATGEHCTAARRVVRRSVHPARSLSVRPAGDANNSVHALRFQPDCV